jgi:hypothetical protein
MLIAFLILLGVDLIVVVVLAALLLGRRRWVKRQPGVFLGAIRVTSGHVEGLGPKWKRGYGRWARDVLVWTKAPLFFRNQLVPMDRIAGQRSAHRDEVKRLGANRSSSSSSPTRTRSRSQRDPSIKPWYPEACLLPAPRQAELIVTFGEHS